MIEPQDQIQTLRSRDLLGTVCLLLGLGGIALVLLDKTAALPWEIARLWMPSPSLMIFASVLLMLAGGRMIWRSEHPKTRWSPNIDGVRFETVLLYTRADCGLCEEAAALLTEYRDYLPPVSEVDIDADPDLTRRFDTCVPVVEIDGKVRFRGRVSEVLLRRLIESTPPITDPARYEDAVPSGDEYSPTGSRRRSD
jgi:hypothetical protein